VTLRIRNEPAGVASLIRRGVEGTTEWRQPVPTEEIEGEELETVPVGRHVTFEIPDGFMATISLVPYTEPQGEPDEAGS
jgi:hypothetical protein